jgi:hypothetical protein
MTCSGLIVVRASSKYVKLPVRTFTAPILNRISPALIRTKSTDRSSVPFSALVSK